MRGLIVAFIVVRKVLPWIVVVLLIIAYTLWATA